MVADGCEEVKIEQNGGHTFSCDSMYASTFLSHCARFHQPIQIIKEPTMKTAVRTDDAGARTQEATKPVPAPVKKLVTDCSRLTFPRTLSLSITFTIAVSPFSRVSRDTPNRSLIAIRVCKSG